MQRLSWTCTACTFSGNAADANCCDVCGTLDNNRGGGGGDGWTCALCTLFNKRGAPACAACGGAQPRRDENGWTCVQCTLRNERSAACCAACGRGRSGAGGAIASGGRGGLAESDPDGPLSRQAVGRSLDQGRLPGLTYDAVQAGRANSNGCKVTGRRREPILSSTKTRNCLNRATTTTWQERARLRCSWCGLAHVGSARALRSSAVT